MKKTIDNKRTDRGAALVVTLIVCTVLAMVLVAMMQNTTLDRASSQSIANQFRAKLAADSGLAFASAAISTNSTNDTFIVVANSNRQLFVGNGIPKNTTYSYIPIFSTAPSLSNPVAPIVTAGVPTTNVASGQIFTFKLSGGISVTSPPVAWVYLTNSDGKTNARFAFWAEDLSGRLDLSVAGSATTATNASRPTGTNPAELGLSSLFTNPVHADQLIAARSNLFTTATARLISSNVTTNMLADLAANLRYDTGEPEFIPFGLGYDADEGKPKFNLNTNLSSNSVAALAEIIGRNLPRFAATRAGAMPTNDYLMNIAANIVDYADTDQNPIVGSGDFPSWRGVEAVPWANEVFTRFSYTNRTIEGGSFKFPLQVKHFVEVWNLSSKPITFNASSCAISNDLNVALKCSNWNGNLSTVDAAKPPAWESFTNGTITMPPNSYRILGAPTRVFDVFVPTNMVGTNPRPSLTVTPAGSVVFGKYAFRVGTSTVDAAVAGRHPGVSTNLRSGDFHYIASASGFGVTRSGGANILQYNLAGGDPRAQLFLVNTPLMGLRYVNSTPGSRNRSLQALGGANTVNPPVNWPDRGHADASDLGPSPDDATESVTTFSNAVGRPDHYLQKINDGGTYNSALELGNIFDPIRWGDSANPFHPLDPAAWMSLTSAGSVSTDGTSAGCGRNSLRIGRFEHPRFNIPGARATQLLDIFAAGLTNGPVVTNQIRGRVNINTANTNVLRALAAGVIQSRDPALLPGGTNFPVPTNAVRAFVSGVTNFRAQSPFLSASQLATITNGAGQWPTNSVFGNFRIPASPFISRPNGDYFGNAALGSVTEWNDEAAEEWFAKVYPLATVRSRNFIVYVIGQALQSPNGTNILSSLSTVYQVHIKPLRDNNGRTTNSVAQVIQSWTL